MAGKAGEQIEKLAKRAGFTSQKALAQAMNKKDASSIQRYYQMDYVPLKWAAELSKTISGKGSPPITPSEVLILAKPELDEILKYIRGLSSSVERRPALLQSDVEARTTEEALVTEKLDEIIKELFVVKDRLRELERAVHALQSKKSDAGPIEAGRTL